MSMDRLVELFLQSARPEGFTGMVPDLDDEALDRGMETVEKMLTSQDAAAMVGTPDATFVCLGMAMEEKPKLHPAAIRCYEKALEFISGRGWERCVVLQQLGAICMRAKRFKEADRRLSECAEACASARGHPREAVLFSGSFGTQQTRLEFGVMVEKLRAKTANELGDLRRAHGHIAEATRLDALASGDAVERQAALGAATSLITTATTATATAATTVTTAFF
ncbi:unnamed protein product [Polarella glacialis]|uniref:Uncharacterized protein n=1 Tax=Polarella glacialis TaxID=89957 RepID=A0A813IT03_POLGL|nr:unnamed protein product [Polarella glacialis]